MEKVKGCELTPRSAPAQNVLGTKCLSQARIDAGEKDVKVQLVDGFGEEVQGTSAQPLRAPRVVLTNGKHRRAV